MTDKFSIPPAATPFMPGAILPVDGIAQRVDPARTVPGTVGQLPAAPASTDGGVQPETVIKLEEDKPVETKPEDLKVCPACGVVLGDLTELHPTDDEKQRWLRHILGEPCFTRTFNMYDNNVSVTFRTRSTAENDLIYKQLMLEVDNGELTLSAGMASPAYFNRMSRLMFLCSLMELEVRTSPPRRSMYPAITEENYPVIDPQDKRTLLQRAYDKIMPNITEGLLAGMMMEHSRFEATVATLIRHSNDTDFWRPTVAGT